MEKQKVKIVHVGMGPLGRKMYRYAIERPSLQVVGAVDVDEAIIGQDLGKFCGKDDAGIRISSSVAAACEKGGADIAVLTTVSDLERAMPQIREILDAGLAVVSTCEELSYPFETSPDLAREIDALAKEKNLAVLGTGINPGFLMDALPSFLTGVCKSVEQVEVSRYQDARFRRIPFQRKIGAGLNMKDFEERKQAGVLRHVGLTESLHFIAGHLGWKLDKTEDLISPVIAKSQIETDELMIRPGQATGVNQVGNGYIGGKLKIRLTFQAAIGEKDSYDEVLITGEPNVYSRIAGGINGDVGTCAVALNAVHSVLNAAPGLRTMGDVPMVTCRL